MADTCNCLPSSVHIKSFDWKFILVVSNHSKEPEKTTLTSLNTLRSNYCSDYFGVLKIISSVKVFYSSNSLVDSRKCNYL